MSKTKEVFISKHGEPEAGSLATYTTGFLLSVILTMWAYLMVVNHSYSRRVILITIVFFALVQFLIQLTYFLHLGREAKPKYKLLTFLFMIMVVFILVFGSIWIMNNLNYRMTPDQMNRYLRSQDGL